MHADTSLQPSGNKLFTSRRFLPMFVAQFLGALEDNLFRNAIFVLVAFKMPASQAHTSGLYISIGAGLFILPFFLFSSVAGTLADRMEKARLIKSLKFVEFPLMFIAGTALVTEYPAFMLLTLFLLGIQAAFFGPVKYSILPQLVANEELVAANGYVEGGTFIAILLGTIAGGALVTTSFGTVLIATLLCLLSFAGWVVSLAIPRSPHGDSDLHLNWNPLATTRSLLADALRQPSIGRAILGISWFWFVGALFLSMLPNYVKDILNGTPALVTFLLALFTIGIALGSFICNRLLRGQLDTRYVPLSLLLMAVAMADLYGLRIAIPGGQTAVTLLDFLTSLQGLTITGLFLLMAVAGGVYTVPLYAVLQARSDARRRARVIAANNVLNALFMVASSIFSFAILKAGFQVTTLFFVTGLLTLVTAVYSLERLTTIVVATVLRLVFSFVYKTRLNGLKHLALLKGRGIVYVANHTSLIDGLLLAAFLPNYPLVVTSPPLQRTWCTMLFHLLSGHMPIDINDPKSLKHLVNSVKAGRAIVVFPEGRLTQTGILMKIYETPGLIASKADAPLVPVRIDGAQYTPFSMLRGKVRLKSFPHIAITILPPVSLKTPPAMTSRARRQFFGTQLYDIMANMMFASCNIERTLYEAFLDARTLQGSKTVIVEDHDRQARTYGQLVVLSRVLGHKLAAQTRKGDYTGVMLPNSIGIVGVVLALLAYGRVPALLNFTSGLANLKAALLAAEIKTIVTSRRFVKIMNLEPVVQELAQEATIVYVEDLRSKINIFDKLRGLVESLFARVYYKKFRASPDDPAVVLFTSGSESAPKGVVLSHKNILANRYQIGTRIDLNASDILFNALPVFHSFGLSVGLFLPLLTGVKVYLYPSPLHYRIIPEVIYETNATILISTDTFLSGYARHAHAYDFYSLRYVVAGGEKLKDETRNTWFEKFGIRILEGYGVTETSPVLAISTTMAFKTGTVGKLVPGVEHSVRFIEGLADEGSLVVRGPNVMLGYLKSDRPGVLQTPYNGWYDTGDVVDIDKEGFVKIIGRAKRFAKIGGEMVSLAAVEAYIQVAFPDKAIAVISTPDPRKGEQLVLFTDEKSLTRDKLIDLAHNQFIPEIMIPKNIVILDDLPRLGTGKFDYVSLNEMGKVRVK